MANARPVAIAEQFAPQAVQFVFVIDPPEGVVNTLRYILRYRVESPLPCTWGINNRLLNYLIRPYNVANVAMAIRDFITVAIKTRVYSPEILLELQRTLPFLKCSIENFSVDTWRSQLLRPPLFSKGTEIVLPSDFPQTSARRFDSIPSHDLPKVFVAFTPPDGNENYPPHPTHLHGDAGFLKFLQERTVPGDTRVTAGGRIVPVELTENSYSHGQHQSFAAEQASNGIMPTFFPVGTPGTLDMTFFPAASIQYANGSFEAARQNNTLTSGVSVGMLSPDLQGLPPVVMDPSQPVWWPEWSQVNDQHFVWTNNHAPFVMDPSMATKPWALPIQMNEIPNQLSYQQFLLKKFALKNELTMLQSPFWTSGDFSKDQIQRIHQETATIEKELEELHARWERSERVLHGEIENMLPPGRILPLPSGVGPDLLVPRSSQQGRHAGSQAGGQLGASSDSNIRLPPLRTLHSNQGMPIGSTIGSRPEQKRKNRVHFEDDLVTKDQTGTNVDKHEPNLEDSEGEKQENRAKRAKPRATSGED
ncbi:MAG: hypothetical protein M1833_000940 [Piccolia ochrophora]|nr:MAG: hypothetical protein M1833_000940 [Piccolia ochrophora]